METNKMIISEIHIGKLVQVCPICNNPHDLVYNTQFIMCPECFDIFKQLIIEKKQQIKHKENEI